MAWHQSMIWIFRNPEMKKYSEMVKFSMTGEKEVSTSEVTSSLGTIIISNLVVPENVMPITSHKLNGQNFLQWSQSVMMFICGKGKEDYLIGKAASPETNDTEYKIQKVEKSMVMSCLSTP